ncbi:MAG: hypothetical protein QM346_00670 [Chloroflexota bacterium]|nr:hypothetical protein [Chloroflexota bacterium]
MGRFFPFRRPQRGMPICLRGLARGLAKMDEALSGMTFENGRVEWSANDVPHLVYGDDGCGSFPGDNGAGLPSVGGASRYPFGPEYPFGISIDGAVVTVYPQIVYHGGTALETEQTDVTILADKDWIIIEFDPDASTPAVVVKRWDASRGLPRDHDGLLVRGIWRFALAGEEGAKAASLDRAGWAPGNLGMMTEDGT